MSKVRTRLMKGKGRWLTAILSLLLAVSLIAGITMTAAAAPADARAYIFVSGGENDSTADCSLSFSIDDTVSLGTSGAFNAVQRRKYWTTESYWEWGVKKWRNVQKEQDSLNKVKAVEIYSRQMNTQSSLRLSLDESISAAEKEKKWTIFEGKEYTRYVYRPGTNITATVFNTLMSQIYVSFNKESTKLNASGTVIIRFWATDKANDLPTQWDEPGSDTWDRSRYKDNLITVPTSSRSCHFTFYSYAEGRTDPESATVDYKSEAAADYEQVYEDYAPAMTANNERVEPADAMQGKVEFDMYISDKGSGANQAHIGYQVKEKGLAWDSTVPIVWLDQTEENGIFEKDTIYEDIEVDDGNGGTTTEQVEVGKTYYNPLDSEDKPMRGYINLADWETDIPIHIIAKECFEAGTVYEVRGVVQTDGKNVYKYTDIFTVIYRKPVIGTFSTGVANAVYKGGDTLRTSGIVTFNDTNAPEDDYTSAIPEQGVIEGGGPALYTKIYFTTELKQTTVLEGETQRPGNDNSIWYPVYEMAGVPNNGTYTFENTFTLPTCMGDIDTELTGAAADEKIDSNKCAYKLVVTDMYTGFSVYTYSDTFTIDSSAPSKPEVVVMRGDGVELTDVTLDDVRDPAKAATVVGGSSAKVRIIISNSFDGNGSGIKEYRYAMYYVSTANTTTGMGSTTEQILEYLGETDSSNARSRGIDYTAWTPAEDALEYDYAKGEYVVDGNGQTIKLKDDYGNKASQITISKDGYYRIDAKAIDNAGYNSEENVDPDEIYSAYFRVDLTAPEQPVVQLVKQQRKDQPASEIASAITNGAKPSAYFSAYDNRTYTDSNVWLFAYSKPRTGKTLNYFEYSIDGGMTWTLISDHAVPSLDEPTVPDGLKIIQLDNGETMPADKKLTVYPMDANGAMTASATSLVPWQVAVSLKGMDVDDYNSILVRATDNLSNQSLASTPAILRTVGQTPTAQSVLEHQGIEVAIAVGNTTMSTSKIAPDLKNKAAYKINEAYYGTDGSDTESAADFNPWKYVINHKHKNTNSGWECYWSTDEVKGACEDPQCPYNYLATIGYNLYTPEMVGVQGMKSASANDQSQFSWTRYDHTMYGDYATVAYNVDLDANGKNIAKAKPTDLSTVTSTYFNARPSEKAKYYNARTGLYTASANRVINIGQNVKGDKASSAAYQTGAVAKATLTGTSASNHSTYSYNDHYNGYYSDRNVFAAQPTSSWPGDKDNLKQSYAYRMSSGTGQMIRRIYHLMDISYPVSVDTSAAKAYDTTSSQGGDLSKLANAGYTNGSFREWLFLYNNQPAKKTIYFTANDGNAVAHTNDGYGFLFNTTIRQSYAGSAITYTNREGTSVTYDPTSKGSDGSWRISGYLLYIGNPYSSNFSGSPEDLSGYRWYVLKLDDVNMEHFSDATIRGAADQNFIGYRYTDTGVLKNGYNNKGSSNSSTGAGYAEDLVKYIVYDLANSKGYAGNIGNYNWGISLLAYRVPYYQSTGGTSQKTNRQVSNFVLQTEGDMTKIYVFQSGLSTNTTNKTDSDVKDEQGNAETIQGSFYTAAQLKKKFASNVNDAHPSGVSDAKNGYKLIEWTTNNAPYRDSENKVVANALNTPRPYVDGIQIGSVDAKLTGVHNDTNCYGFGPLYAARSYSHWCFADTRIEISNIVMSLNVAKSLAEVVTEPQWGTGQAKFIANISDDSIEDFQDPILSAQIQWRLFNDNAKFIGWGGYDNGEVTEQFIDRIEGDGMYEYTEKNDRSKVPYTTQIEDVATYITAQYYQSLGYDLDTEIVDGKVVLKGDSINDQVNDQVSGEGTVYDLETIKNVEFSVTPAKYNTSTANPDFPSGRWYVVHDATGYYDTRDSGRSGTYSDGLDLQISEPGRYVIYFAPDTTKVKNGTLNPKDAIFNFVVNEAPIAQFNGFIGNGTDEGQNGVPVNEIFIDDGSYDPDAGAAVAGVQPKPMARYYTYKMNGETKTYNLTPHADGATANDIQITGIGTDKGKDKIFWRWEILAKYINTLDDTNTLYVAAAGGWSQTSPHGQTISSLTYGKVTENATHLGYLGTAVKEDSNEVKYLEELPPNAVLTVYQKVEDVSTQRVAVTNAKGEVVGYDYKFAGSTESNVKQQNLTSGTQITYAPLSSFSLSTTIMYDTATDEGGTDVITVTRKSKQTQQKQYEVSFAMDLNDGYGYRHLVYEESTGDFYLYPTMKTKDGKVVASNDYYPEVPSGSTADAEQDVLHKVTNSVLPAKIDTVNITKCAEGVYDFKKAMCVMKAVDKDEIKVDENGDATGQWEISKGFLQSFGTGNSIVIRITESLEGKTSSTQTDNVVISDSSARAIYYKADATPPSGQVVTAKVESKVRVKDSDGNFVMDEEGNPVYEMVKELRPVTKTKVKYSNVTVPFFIFARNEHGDQLYSADGEELYVKERDITVEGKDQPAQMRINVTYAGTAYTKDEYEALPKPTPTPTPTPTPEPSPSPSTEPSAGTASFTVAEEGDGDGDGSGTGGEGGAGGEPTPTPTPSTEPAPAVQYYIVSNRTEDVYGTKTEEEVTEDEWVDTDEYLWVESDYEASNYLDVTGGEKRIVVSASEAKDGQGAVAGYAFYFYEKSGIPSNTSGANDSCYESAIYYIDSDGVLHNEPIVAYKSGTTVVYEPTDGYTKIELNESQGSTWLTSLTADQRGQAVQAAKKRAIDKTASAYKLSSEGGTITIDSDTIASLLSGADAGHSVSLNLAIYAYDNATGVLSPTGANEGQKTRMENIKLTKSVPMPPEIVVTNALNLNVATVGNWAAFNLGEGQVEADYLTEEEVKEKAALGKNENKQYSELHDSANTAVTVQFKPRKAPYKKDANGNYYLSSSGTDYYQDIYGEADLTGVANVLYKVEWRPSPDYTYTELDTDTIASAKTLSFNTDGQYCVTAQIVNGAGTVSETRTVVFIVDTVAPSEPTVVARIKTVDGQELYKFGEWTSEVTIYISGSSDVNMAGAEYKYTLDDGKEWKSLGSLGSSPTFAITESGQHTLRVKAVDLAGNEQVYGYVVSHDYPKAESEEPTNRSWSVRIDGEAPNTPGPVLTAASKTDPVYTEYLISLDYDTQLGKVRHSTINGENESKTGYDTLIGVKTGGSAKLYLEPKENVLVNGVIYNGDPIDPETDASGTYYLLENVTQNGVFAVEFEKQETMTSQSYNEDLLFRTAAQMNAILETANEPEEVAEHEAVHFAGVAAEGDGNEPAPIDEPGVDVPTRRIVAMAFGNGSLTPSTQDVRVGERGKISITPRQGYEVAAIYYPDSTTLAYKHGDTNANFIDNRDGSFDYYIPVTEDTPSETYAKVEFQLRKTRTVKLTYSDCGSASFEASSDITISGSGIGQANVGSTIYINVIPQNGYDVSEITVKENGTTTSYGKVNMDSSGFPLDIEAFTGEEGTDTGYEVNIKFDIPSGSVYYEYDVIKSLQGGNDSDYGTVVPGDAVVKVPKNGSRIFTITPKEPGYMVYDVQVTTKTGGNNVTTSFRSALKPVSSDSRAKTWVFSANNKPGSIRIIFKPQVYKIDVNTVTGGSVTVESIDKDTGELKQLSLKDMKDKGVPEGTLLRFTAKADEGYRLTDLAINAKSNSFSQGAVTTFELLGEGISDDLTVTPTFVKRKILRSDTAHTIIATATGVKDAQDNLLASDGSSKPYRFRITDGVHIGDWTEWSDDNTYTFDCIKMGELKMALKPNIEYTVQLQTRDTVDNYSEIDQKFTKSSTSIYTLANTPIITAGEAINTPGDPSSKSIALNIDPNDNPAYTEYMVYYSTSPTMSPLNIANEGRENQWSMLEEGQLRVDGLSPGVRYYLQVVARNQISQKVTELNDDNIIAVMLTPASPPAASMYFDEQDGPGGPITLGWSKPEGAVLQVIIYRDGKVIASVDTTTSLRTIIDDDEMEGDHIGTYTYAYVNSAGTGSTQTAVSKVYYDWFHAGETEEDDTGEEPGTGEPGTEPETSSSGPTEEELEHLKNLNQIVADAGFDVFGEYMTYPVFPLAGARTLTASSGAGDTSGRITMSMTRDDTMDRYQRYHLKLRAFDATETLDDNGNVIDKQYTEVTDSVLWGAYYQTYNSSTGKYDQQEVVTYSVNSNGASVQWNNLNTRYEYQIVVEKIESLGPQRVGDGYGGQYSPGVEYSLGKTYYVTKDKYGYRYDTSLANIKDSAKALIELELKGKEYTWTEEARNVYLNNTDWDQPINKNITVAQEGNGTEYIVFDKSPSAELAYGSLYVGNDAEKTPVSTDSTGYLLVDNSMKDTKIYLKVAAWDPDSKPNDPLSITATIGNTKVTGSVVTEDGEAVPAMKHDRTEAFKAENLYTLEFDVSGLATGCYEGLKLSVSDGTSTSETELPYTDERGTTYPGIKLYINNTTPSISMNKTGVRRVETQKVYDLDELKITSLAAEKSVSEDMAKIRLLVMPTEFTKAFGSGATTVDNIVSILTSSSDENKTARENARALIGLTGSDALTKDQALKAIAYVNPPMTYYVRIMDGDKFAAIKATLSESDQKKYLREETNHLSPYYWVEYNYALTTNDPTDTSATPKKICDWMEWDTGNKMKITGEPGEYYVELVSTFGGNQSAQMVTVQINKAPSVSVMSDQYFGWTESLVDAEYKYYSQFTLAQVINMNKESARVQPDLTTYKENDDNQDITALTTMAAQMIDGKKMVFKLTDSQGLVSMYWLQGKLDTTLGIYEKFESLGVYITTDDKFDPSTYASLDAIPASYRHEAATKDADETTYNREGQYTFSVENLTEGKTYYLWGYFTVKDPVTKEIRTGFSKSNAVLTTLKEYDLVYYGFENTKYRYYEENYSDRLGLLTYRATGVGSNKPAGTLSFNLEYFQADEFGNILYQKDDSGQLVLDAEGQPIPLKIVNTDEAKRLDWAKETLGFASDADKVTTNVSNRGDAYVTLILNDTDKAQGHMVVRMSLQVESQKVEYVTLSPGREYTDIFVRDNESDIQSFRMKVYEEKHGPKNDKDLVLTSDSDGVKYYTYTMEGLQVKYYNNTETLTIGYQTDGTGDLENITAMVCEDMKGTKLSEAFQIVQQPTEKNITSGMTDRIGYVSVSCVAGLDDDVYDAWLILKADNMENKDYLRVKIRQIVGQSTLTGRVYITNTNSEPSADQWNGVSTVCLYDGTRSTSTLNDNYLLYSVKTDEKGYYTIPNVINDTKYHVVVKRDGFITYNSADYSTPEYIKGVPFYTEEDSKTYSFTIRLIGGDVDGDSQVTKVDLEYLADSFFTVFDRNNPPENATEEQLERWRILCLVDYNQDGAVNALDRAYLYNNIGSTKATYANYGGYMRIKSVTG